MYVTGIEIRSVLFFFNVYQCINIVHHAPPWTRRFYVNLKGWCVLPIKIGGEERMRMNPSVLLLTEIEVHSAHAQQRSIRIAFNTSASHTEQQSLCRKESAGALKYLTKSG